MKHAVIITGTGLIPCPVDVLKTNPDNNRDSKRLMETFDYEKDEVFREYLSCRSYIVVLRFGKNNQFPDSGFRIPDFPANLYSTIVNIAVSRISSDELPTVLMQTGESYGCTRNGAVKGNAGCETAEEAYLREAVKWHLTGILMKKNTKRCVRVERTNLPNV